MDVWITGVGVVTPLGTDFNSVADALLAGRSAVTAVTAFDAGQHPSRVAARIASVPCPPGHDPTAFAARPRSEQAALWCGVSALRDAGLEDPSPDPVHEVSPKRRGEKCDEPPLSPLPEAERGLRIGLVLGGGGEWLPAWEDHFLRTGDASAPGVPPSSADAVRVALGLTGPAVTLSTACASGNHALAVARRWLRFGWADVVLAGAADLNCTPVTLAAFGNLRALSRRNDDPARASRPFDRGRDGFVLGEGAALLVLERVDHARQRGATPYARLAGIGMTSDAFHMVAPCSEPTHAADAIRRALADAGACPDDVDYINAHGTATAAGDVAECMALRMALGEAANRVPVSSTKSMTGHLLTAAAAVEAVACLAAMRRGAVPPTVNLDDPDPACAVRHVPCVAEPHRVRLALSNAFGFGGSNSCVAFEAA